MVRLVGFPNHYFYNRTLGITFTSLSHQIHLLFPHVSLGKSNQSLAPFTKWLKQHVHFHLVMHSPRLDCTWSWVQFKECLKPISTWTMVSDPVYHLIQNPNIPNNTCFKRTWFTVNFLFRFRQRYLAFSEFVVEERTKGEKEEKKQQKVVGLWAVL